MLLRRSIFVRRYVVDTLLLSILLISILLLSSVASDGVSAGQSDNSLSQLTTDRLVRHDGEIFQPNNVSGKIVLLVFGFTHCPDICPLELTEVGRVLNDVDSPALTALFVSLDPERDTVDRLARYVPYFHENIMGVTGDSAQIHQMAEAFGVRYRRVEQGSDYVIDHSTGVYILGKDGTTRAIAPFGASAEHLKSIVSNLLGS